MQEAVAKGRSAKALEDKVTEIEQASNLLDAVSRELQLLLGDLVRIDALLPQASRTKKKTLREARNTLLALSHDLVNAGTPDAVTEVEKKIDTARGPLIQIWNEKKAGSGATVASSTLAYRALGTRRPPVRDIIEVEEQDGIGHAETDISDKDRIVGVLAFAIAVASGMATLYFTNTSWGEPGDYLAALAWGGITGEGVKLAANIADRKFPG